MDKYIFTSMLCDQYSVSPSCVVKKKHGNNPEITFSELCQSIYELDTLETMCKFFGGMSPKTLRPALLTAFPDIAAKKDKSTVWRVELLLKLGYRRCTECAKEKILEDFYSNTKVKAGKSYVCKDCTSVLTKQYHLENPEVARASNAKRRAILKGSNVNGANLSTIKRIYQECPEGYHVDHIYPLFRGGAHHETNLCYLPIKLNMKKQYKLPNEVPEIMKYAIYPDLTP